MIRSEGRNQGIDVLRGLAIGMVVLSHYELPDNFGQGSAAQVLGRTLADIREGMGYYGVAIFFVVSGFLITSGVLRRWGTLGQINRSGFWWLRFSRIVPVLGLTLAVMIAFHFFWLTQFRFQTSDDLWQTVARTLSFHFGTFPESSIARAWNPLWSLSVEEMFYLVFPLACLVIDGFAAMVWVLLWVIATAVFVRFSGLKLLYATEGCMDLLGLGCLLAVLRPERLREAWPAARVKFAGWASGATGLGLIAAIVVARHPYTSFVWAPLVAGLGACLAVSSTQLLGVPAAGMAMALLPLSILGIISYEIYLFHGPVSVFLEDTGLLAGNNWWLLPAVTVTAALLTHVFFSEPMNETLRTLGGRAGAGAGPASPARLWRRCVLLGAGPLLGVLALGWIKAASENSRHVEFRLVEVANLPAGAVEPLVYSGKTGAGQLIYLRHEENGNLRLGVDYWAKDGLISGFFPATNITGGVFRVIFARDRIDIYYEGGILLRATQTSYAGAIGPIGTNGPGFKVALPGAISKLVEVR